MSHTLLSCATSNNALLPAVLLATPHHSTSTNRTLLQCEGVTELHSSQVWEGVSLSQHHHLCLVGQVAFEILAVNEIGKDALQLQLIFHYALLCQGSGKECDGHLMCLGGTDLWGEQDTQENEGSYRRVHRHMNAHVRGRAKIEHAYVHTVTTHIICHGHMLDAWIGQR